MEMVRSIMKEKELPAKFWGEAVRHAVYVLNRLPTRALTGVTPYEAWKGDKPDVSHIRVFGCLCHMRVPSQGMKKLDDRSVLVINLGREPGTKGYRLFCPEENKIYVSKDVVFEEGKCWQWSNEREDGDTQVLFHVAERLDQVDDNESRVLETNEGGQYTSESGEGYESSASSTVHGTPSAASAASLSQTTPCTRSSVSSRSVASRLDSDNYDDSVEPLKVRRLSDIYNDTEEVTLDEELYLMGTEEPANFKEASKDKNWRRAMEAEINSIEKNATWKLTEIPAGQKIIGLKWIFKLKKDAAGKIVKHKARLVAKEYAQEHELDYEEVFAPVTRLETVRMLLALSVKNSWQVHHLDVKTAFLNGEITEDVFVAQPEGFEISGKEHMVYKLVKALFGLKQAPRAWYAKLNHSLESLGFKRCPYENAVYTKGTGNDCLIIAVYVDDILITGASVQKMEEFKQQMGRKFDMTDLGKLCYYLGIEVKQEAGYIELKQSGYAAKLLERAGMSDCNPNKYPMDPKEEILKDEKGRAVDATMYKSLVGGLRYLVNTRPDIAFSVGMVSRYMERPTTLHLSSVKRIMRYVKGTLQFGLIYNQHSGNNVVTGYSDSDLGGAIDDRRSTGGMAYYLNESLISWVSQKQRVVALSSCEAELMAATAAACQGIWLKNVLGQITGDKLGPVVLFIDNKSAIDLAKNPMFHGRSKHIDVRFHFIRECVERGEVIVKHVSSLEQRADGMTKALATIKFEKMRNLLGVRELEI